MKFRYSGRGIQVKPIPLKGGWSYSIHVEEATGANGGMQITPDPGVFNSAEKAVEAGAERAMAWLDRAQLEESGSVFA